MKANGYCPDLMRPTSIVLVGTDQLCDPLELLGAGATCGRAGFPLALPCSLWGSREVEVGTRGRGWSSTSPASSILRAGLHTGRSTPLPPTILPSQSPAQTPPGLHCARAPQVPSLSKWRTPIPLGFSHCKEQVISTLSPGLFSTAL